VAVRQHTSLQPAQATQQRTRARPPASHHVSYLPPRSCAISLPWDLGDVTSHELRAWNHLTQTRLAVDPQRKTRRQHQVQPQIQNGLKPPLSFVLSRLLRLVHARRRQRRQEAPSSCFTPNAYALHGHYHDSVRQHEHLNMLPLVPTLALAILSFISSAFVILRIVIPICE
jgi:hypothetical protein